jgi:S-adenosylmethionine hydrolase
MSVPIFLFSDFGSADLYVGQVKAVLHAQAPASAVIDLFNDAPPFRIEESAHLLAALAVRLPPAATTLAVVDPGVGTGRAAVALEADGRWFVGPDNGLLSVVAARSRSVRVVSLDAMARPESVSFHGRDLFAPAAATLARAGAEPATAAVKARLDVELGSADLARVVHIDHYGNAMTGLRAGTLEAACAIDVAGQRVRYARVFADAPRGALFWYENSIGLIEIAANQASAAERLALAVGAEVGVHS